MRADDPNLPQLRQIAEALGDLRDQVVFVGGAVAGLLVTDPLADPVRATRDVDAVVNANRTMFYRVEEATRLSPGTIVHNNGLPCLQLVCSSRVNQMPQPLRRRFVMSPSCQAQLLF